MSRVKRWICLVTEHKPWYFPGGWECLRCGLLRILNVYLYRDWLREIRF